MKISIIVTLILIAVVHTIPPPLWPQRFTQDFIQGDSSSKVYTSGKLWYDIKNNRQRSDFKNDYFDLLCSSVSSRTNSTCSQVIMNDNLYIWLPDQNLCCKCCTKEEGCAITPRDWLKDYEYIGVKSMNWDMFFAWTHYDLPVNTTYFATTYEPFIPRRMSYGSYGVDFQIGSFNQDEINESVFNLPSYCSNDCPKTSFCQNFKVGNVRKSVQNFGFMIKNSKNNNVEEKNE